MDDPNYFEAVGWATSVIGGRRLADEAHRASQAGCPKVAKYLLGWADHCLPSLGLADIEDRRREYKATNDLVVDLELAEEIE